MKLDVEVSLPDWIAELRDHERKTWMSILISEANELIEQADRRLVHADAPRSLRRQRDRLVSSVLDRAVGVLTVELVGRRVSVAGVTFAGLHELEHELAKDAVRTCKREPREPGPFLAERASPVSPSTPPNAANGAIAPRK